jgi:hypothetical protein
LVGAVLAVFLVPEAAISQIGICPFHTCVAPDGQEYCSITPCEAQAVPEIPEALVPLLLLAAAGLTFRIRRACLA